MKLSMRTTILKRSIVINGRKTSVSLEDDFWELLKARSDKADKTIGEFVDAIDAERRLGGLSSAIRVAMLRAVMDEAAKAKQLLVPPAPLKPAQRTPRGANAA